MGTRRTNKQMISVLKTENYLLRKQVSFLEKRANIPKARNVKRK